MSKKVVVIGGTGGLGQAYVKAFLSLNYDVFIGGRNIEKINTLFSSSNDHLPFSYINLLDYDSVLAFAKEAQEKLGEVDYVINATGYDIRKSLDSHSQEDIDLSLEVNLRGAIYITKAFIPIMRPQAGSIIVNMGGFVDGGLAFPYYSVDVASRAGIFSFTESMNRELKQEHNPVRLTYFCPNAADTQAERPYHPIWKEMKTKISSPEEVSTALLHTLKKQKTVSIMGGWIYSLGAKINHISTGLSNLIIMNQYSSILQNHLNPNPQDLRLTKNKKLILAGILLILSCMVYLFIPVVLTSKLTTCYKTFFLVMIEASAWILFAISGIFGGKTLWNHWKKILCPIKK